MKFPLYLTALIALSAIFLIVSYPVLLAGNAEKLWGPIRGNLRTLYYISIFLVLLGFIPFAYYLLTCGEWSKSEINAIFYTLMVLIFASWLWIILAVLFATKPSYLLRVLIVIILLIVSLSILYLIYILRNHSHFIKSTGFLKTLIYIGLIYGFFHTFFMDFILWAYLVLRK